MTAVLIRGGRFGHRNTQGVWGGGVMLQEDRGRDGRMQVGAKKQHGLPGATSSWKRQEGSTLRAFGGSAVLLNFDFELLASRTVREYVSIVLSHLVCVLPLQQLRKT